MGDNFKRYGYAAAAATTALVPAMAFAEGETATITTVKTAVTDMATTVQTNVLDIIAQILPIAAVVIAAILVATKGVKLVSRFVGGR